ncbi:MAG: hypothetical protein SGJ18_03485 [Pseudomonadota bacterium]|nr:hypothetical protein [Pseudomonadota bacterium]
MKVLHSILTVLIVLAVGQVSQAQFGRTQQLTLDFYDYEIGGQEALRLKEEIQRQYPRINLQYAELLSVQLVAKSRMGRAHASLRVGGAQSGDYTISGNPHDWFDGSEYTFDTTYFNNDRGASQGPWQIIITGNVKIRRVHLTINQRQPRPGPQPPPYPHPGPSRIVNVKGQGYYPDQLTAQGICLANNLYRAVGFTTWRQAGAALEGKRSFDGSAFFHVDKWYTGIAIDTVNCQ